MSVLDVPHIANGKGSDLKTDIQVGEVASEPFENILNFRDVGKTINKFLGDKYVSSSAAIDLGLTSF
jgi:hypothetical protein